MELIWRGGGGGAENWTMHKVIISCVYFVENKMLFWVSNQMLLWERISMNLAVLINILVALFYPFSGTVRGRTKYKVVSSASYLWRLGQQLLTNQENARPKNSFC